jgi:hypothetical protein
MTIVRMQTDMFNSILYNLYDIFFEKLSSASLKNLALVSLETNRLMMNSGGFAKSISFDWKTDYSVFFRRLSEHKNIIKMYFNGSGTQISILDILPPQTNIKILILKDSPDTNMCRSTTPVVSSKLAKPVMRRRKVYVNTKQPVMNNAVYNKKVNIWKNIKYIFIRDNNSQQYNIGLENFPNIDYIGMYKASVIFIQDTVKSKQPHAMEFRDNQSIELMVEKNPLAIDKITRQLKKIYS